MMKQIYHILAFTYQFFWRFGEWGLLKIFIIKYISRVVEIRNLLID